MTSTTRIITTALAMLAIAVPAASAMPLYEHGDTATTERSTADIRTSSLAGTTSAPVQDLRNADQRAPQPAEPTQDFRNPDNRAPRCRGRPGPDGHESRPGPAVAVLARAAQADLDPAGGSRRR